MPEARTKKRVQQPVVNSEAQKMEWVVKSKEGETLLYRRDASGAIEVGAPGSTSIETGASKAESTQHTILIVDDEKSVLNSLKRMLAGEEYRIVTTECPVEGLDLISTGQFSVIISDYSMPSISGADLLAIVKEKIPHCIRIMLTGAAETENVPDQIANSILHCQRFITKPWDDEKLRQTIRECIRQFEESGQ